MKESKQKKTRNDEISFKWERSVRAFKGMDFAIINRKTKKIGDMYRFSLFQDSNSAFSLLFLILINNASYVFNH